MEYGPYMKHPTTRSGGAAASTGDVVDTGELPLVLREASGSGSGSHLSNPQNTEMIPFG